MRDLEGGATKEESQAAQQAQASSSASSDLPGLKVTHVVVTTGQLIPTLAKLMLFKLSGLISPENVYSARKIGKSACFDRIWLRFGEAAKFCVIGDGKEEELAARQRAWPYIRISLGEGSGTISPVQRQADSQGSILGVPITSITALQLLKWTLAPPAGPQPVPASV
eukprot:jgi/Botrbrau1/3313/Bobra.0048s0010.1